MHRPTAMLLLLVALSVASIEARKAFRNGIQVKGPPYPSVDRPLRRCDSKTELGICRLTGSEQKTRIGNLPKTTDDKDMHLILRDGARHQDGVKEDDFAFFSPLVTTAISRDEDAKGNKLKDYVVGNYVDLRKEWADKDRTRLRGDGDFGFKLVLADTSCNEPDTNFICCGSDNTCVWYEKCTGDSCDHWHRKYDTMRAAEDAAIKEQHRAAMQARGVVDICCEITTTLTGKAPTTEQKTMQTCEDAEGTDIMVPYKEGIGDDRGMEEKVGTKTTKPLCSGPCPCSADAQKHLDACPALQAQSYSCFDPADTKKCLGPDYYVKVETTYIQCGSKKFGKPGNENCFDKECSKVA